MPPPAATPAVCYLRDWVCFGPGYWKGQLYSRADCLAMGENFRRLSAGPAPLVVPRVKIGHDVEGRLQKSLGFPALGRVYGMRVTPGGLCSFDLEIPTQVGALRNADLFVDGSIEIAPPLPDPEDAGRELYPVLVALSLLGEEQPAVPMRHPMPRAVFADGTQVPPERDLTPLASAMAEVARTFARDSGAAGGSFSYRGRVYATAAVCFSAMTPLPGKTMTPEQKSALAAAGFTPEQITQMEAALGGGGGTMAATPPSPPAPPPDPLAGLQKFNDDPAVPPFAKAMMSAFSAFAADCNKRFSAAEAAVGDIQKLKPDAQMAAKFSRDYQERVQAEKRRLVEREVDSAVLAGKLLPTDRADFVTAGMAKGDAHTFAAGHAHAGKTELQVWVEQLHARSASSYFRQEVTGGDTGDPLEDRFVRETLGHLPKGRQIVAAAK